jgi:hypothetical protein
LQHACIAVGIERPYLDERKITLNIYDYPFKKQTPELGIRSIKS